MPRQRIPKDKPNARFHGRVAGASDRCAQPGCDAEGEFRVPPAESGNGSDQPRPWRWMCLDHVREFNATYNFFQGMSPEEIEAQQRPYAGWERATRAFSTNGGDRPPRWADFVDPLDAIGARFGERLAKSRVDGRPLGDRDRRDLKIMGLEADADRRALRMRYAELVRRYHPDRNGGDRSHERALQDVIDAYTRLKSAPAFA